MEFFHLDPKSLLIVDSYDGNTFLEARYGEASVSVLIDLSTGRIPIPCSNTVNKLFLIGKILVILPNSLLYSLY
jgi:hypothetical protein